MKSPQNKSTKKKTTATKRLAIIGLGYVGWPLVLLAMRRGYRVHGIDIDSTKIEKLQSSLDTASNSITLAATFEGVAEVETMVVCVPTPVHENHEPDLEPLKNAAISIAPHLKRDQLIIIESTVNPGVCEEVVLPLLLAGSGLAQEEIYFAHCPERINPGDPKWNVENIPRVVGALNAKSLKRAIEFYESVLTGAIKPLSSLKEAEAVKMVENSFRDINIAFVNELGMSFSRLGIDVMHVIEGASTKPFGFMTHYPGCGVGGHCIPVDPYYLITYAKQNGFTHRFLAMAREVNNAMPAFAVSRLIEAFAEAGMAPRGKRVALLGIAYKPNIEDYRESPSLAINDELVRHGIEVQSFDPHVPEHSSAKTLKAALQGTDAVIVATAHDSFRELTPGYLKRHGVRIVIDGRNCLPKEQFVKAGMTYRGIGR